MAWGSARGGTPRRSFRGFPSGFQEINRSTEINSGTARAPTIAPLEHQLVTHLLDPRTHPLKKKHKRVVTAPVLWGFPGTTVGGTSGDYLGFLATICGRIHHKQQHERLRVSHNSAEGWLSGSDDPTWVETNYNGRSPGGSFPRTPCGDPPEVSPGVAPEVVPRDPSGSPQWSPRRPLMGFPNGR
jgi:hypothetical protein